MSIQSIYLASREVILTNGEFSYHVKIANGASQMAIVYAVNEARPAKRNFDPVHRVDEKTKEKSFQKAIEWVVEQFSEVEQTEYHILQKYRDILHTMVAVTAPFLADLHPLMENKESTKELSMILHNVATHLDGHKSLHQYKDKETC